METKKILIVEDDPMLGEIYEKKFSQGKFEVVLAIDGTEALEKIRSERPDVVLLDLVLPEDDGFNVLKKIKSDESIKDTKVIIFSNLSQEEDRQKAEVLGAEGFIAKSDFTPQQTVQEIEAILSKATPGIKNNTKEKNGSSANKGKANGGSKKILMVEDEEVFIDVFGSKLENEGFSFDSATNGAWGLKKIKENKYDIILLDILMPAVDGMEVIKTIRGNNGPNSKTPIIVLSNSITDEQAAEVIKAGANDFSIKTRLTPSELVEKVRELVD